MTFFFLYRCQNVCENLQGQVLFGNRVCEQHSAGPAWRWVKGSNLVFQLEVSTVILEICPILWLWDSHHLSDCYERLQVTVHDARLVWVRGVGSFRVGAADVARWNPQKVVQFLEAVEVTSCQVVVTCEDLDFKAILSVMSSQQCDDDRLALTRANLQKGVVAPADLQRGIVCFMLRSNNWHHYIIAKKKAKVFRWRVSGADTLFWEALRRTSLPNNIWRLEHISELKAFVKVLLEALLKDEQGGRHKCPDSNVLPWIPLGRSLKDCEWKITFPASNVFTIVFLSVFIPAFLKSRVTSMTLGFVQILKKYVLVSTFVGFDHNRNIFCHTYKNSKHDFDCANVVKHTFTDVLHLVSFQNSCST